MEWKVVNSSFVLLSNFVVSRQESGSKSTKSHKREPLWLILKDNTAI